MLELEISIILILLPCVWLKRWQNINNRFEALSDVCLFVLPIISPLLFSFLIFFILFLSLSFSFSTFFFFDFRSFLFFSFRFYLILSFSLSHARSYLFLFFLLQSNFSSDFLCVFSSLYFQCHSSHFFSPPFPPILYFNFYLCPNSPECRLL